MSDSGIKLSSGLCWQTLRKRADILGIPAWKLAEEYAFHRKDEKKIVLKS